MRHRLPRQTIVLALAFAIVYPTAGLAIDESGNGGRRGKWQATKIEVRAPTIVDVAVELKRTGISLVHAWLLDRSGRALTYLMRGEWVRPEARLSVSASASGVPERFEIDASSPRSHRMAIDIPVDVAGRYFLVVLVAGEDAQDQSITIAGDFDVEAQTTGDASLFTLSDFENGNVVTVNAVGYTAEHASKVHVETVIKHQLFASFVSIGGGETTMGYRYEGEDVRGKRRYTFCGQDVLGLCSVGAPGRYLFEVEEHIGADSEVWLAAADVHLPA